MKRLNALQMIIPTIILSFYFNHKKTSLAGGLNACEPVHKASAPRIAGGGGDSCEFIHETNFH